MTKTQEPQARLWLDEESHLKNNLEELIVGDVVNLEFSIPMSNMIPGNPTQHAVFEREENGQYYFLNLDYYRKHPTFLKRVSAKKEDISLKGHIYLREYKIQDVWGVTRKERSDKIRLLKEGLNLLRKAYTFDEVIYHDENRNIVEIERNKSII